MTVPYNLNSLVQKDTQRANQPVESEEALHAIVVISCSILLCKLQELQIHGTIEVCPQEVRPKAK